MTLQPPGATTDGVGEVGEVDIDLDLDLHAAPGPATPGGHAGPPSEPARPWRRLAELNEVGLARLAAADGPHRQALLELLETSCLLQLARLASSGLDLASHVQVAAELLTELFPCRGCRIEVTLPGLTPVAVVAGEEPGSPAVEVPLVVDGTLAGRVVFGPLRVDLGPTTFFHAAAEQLSVDIRTVAGAEQLRRRAAVAQAHQAAASVRLDDPERSLRRLVHALAAWPGTVAAALTVEAAGLGAPVQVHAGWWEDDGRPRGELVAARPGMAVRLRRGVPEAGPSDAALDGVLDELERALARLDRERRLLEESETDPLTGAGNRRRLDRVLARELGRAERVGGRVAVLAVDLDHFKRVNDTLGHEAGDRVLVAVVDALRAELRAYDEVVRTGGEEFVVVVPGCDVVTGRRLAERVLAGLPVRCAGALPAGWRQTVSIGLAVFPDMATEPGPLLRMADGALYRAKRSGRATVRTAKPGDALLFPEPPAAPSSTPAPHGSPGPHGPPGPPGPHSPASVAAEGEPDGAAARPSLATRLLRLTRSRRGSSP